MSADSLLTSLTKAVAAAPDDVALRVHLAELLDAAGEHAEAIRHAAAALQREPANERVHQLIAGSHRSPGSEEPDLVERPTVETSEQGAVLADLDAQLDDVVPPRFVDSGADSPAMDIERSALRLRDVAGMEQVKSRLEAAVLAPMRNPELTRLYGKSLSGGLLLYGPPGCGKTFIARALAGELGAAFLSVSLADVLDMYIGQSERNLHELFETARRHSPCVLFFDELDAIGQKRSQTRGSAMRGTVNQLLFEMDGVAEAGDGVFVLGATNHPWDVDVALRRPGRLDRMLLVLPPDEPARRAVLALHLQNRPVAGVDLDRLARGCEGYSGADLAHVCETAAELALLDSARSGTVRMIEMKDLTAALEQVQPSVGPWLAQARNVAQFANRSGEYDELLAYLKSQRLV